MPSNFLWRILIHSSAEATPPTAPGVGSNISSITGWYSLGSVARGDDANLDSDAIEVAFLNEQGEILPPVALTREELIQFQNGADGFEFTAYDTAQALLELASDITESGGDLQKTLTPVYRSVVLETNGLHYDYFPKVRLMITGLPVGIAGDGQAKTSFEVKCNSTDTYPGGWMRRVYQ